GLVSDDDDTIVETGLTRGIEFVRGTLLTPVRERTPLPGAAALYRALAEPADGPPRPVFYVSTSPWNLHEMLLEFISLRRFPLGPLLLTDWGPSRSGLFRIGAQEHKGGLVRRMLAEHPQLGLVLVGDRGQLDPEIYAGLAREYPDRIRAVYIRRTRHALPSRIAEVDALAAEATAAGVPMRAVDDSLQIATHAAQPGLLDAAAAGAELADVEHARAARGGGRAGERAAGVDVALPHQHRAARVGELDVPVGAAVGEVVAHDVHEPQVVHPGGAGGQPGVVLGGLHGGRQRRAAAHRGRIEAPGPVGGERCGRPLRVEPAQCVAVREQHDGGRDAAPADVAALPDRLGVGRGQRGDDGAAAHRAAGVVLAVGADQHQRARVALPGGVDGGDQLGGEPIG